MPAAGYRWELGLRSAGQAAAATATVLIKQHKFHSFETSVQDPPRAGRSVRGYSDFKKIVSTRAPRATDRFNFEGSYTAVFTVLRAKTMAKTWAPREDPSRAQRLPPRMATCLGPHGPPRATKATTGGHGGP